MTVDWEHYTPDNNEISVASWTVTHILPPSFNRLGRPQIDQPRRSTWAKTLRLSSRPTWHTLSRPAPEFYNPQLVHRKEPKLSGCDTLFCVPTNSAIGVQIWPNRHRSALLPGRGSALAEAADWVEVGHWGGLSWLLVRAPLDR